MSKNTIKYVFVFLVLFLIQSGTAKEAKHNYLWCFTLSEASSLCIKGEVVDFQVKYQMGKTGKWKNTAKTLCGWGFQPDFSLQRCFQFYTPANISAFEITLFQKQQTLRILIDQLPDSLSKYNLIGLNHLSVKEKNNQFTFNEIKEKVVSLNFSPDIYPMTTYFSTPRIESNQVNYDLKSPIKIYIESNDTLQSMELYGCGTPGTLYIVQQWLNGVWTEYTNNWSVKCPHQKFIVNRYIVPFVIAREGIFRVVFDNPASSSAAIPQLVSNPFQIRSN